MATTNIQINKDPYDSQLFTITGNPCALFVPNVVFTIPIFVSASQSSSKQELVCSRICTNNLLSVIHLRNCKKNVKKQGGRFLSINQDLIEKKNGVLLVNTEQQLMPLNFMTFHKAQAFIWLSHFLRSHAEVNLSLSIYQKLQGVLFSLKTFMVLLTVPSF